MNIIDFHSKGHVIRFYLGENGKQWGDDWNDVPYEHNAGSVYSQFVQGYKDIVVPFDDQVYFPDSGVMNSQYSKEDMINRIIPCVVVVPREVFIGYDGWEDEFKFWNNYNNAKIQKFYFGDELS